MSSTFNIEHYRGDTYTGQEFSLKESTLVDVLPVTGDPLIVYKVASTGLYFQWGSTGYTSVTGGIPIDLTGATLLGMVRQNHYLPVLHYLQLTITDAVNGVLAIEEQIINIAGGIYSYDIQITFPDGVVKTYIQGTMTITEDYSYE